MEEEFFVVLPSNTISDEFPQNKISNFSIGLPTQLTLGSYNWEVALAEISYPHTWYNIDESFAFIDVTVYTYNGSDSEANQKRLNISPGHYNNGVELIYKINQTLKANLYQSKFRYSEKSNKASVILYISDEFEEVVRLPTKLASVLGFHKNYLGTRFLTIPKPSTSLWREDAESCVDLSINTHNLFIYTNIIKETLVGNQYVPLLRTVPTLEKNRNTYVSVQFTNFHYIPLVSNYIKQITIDIRDDQGDNIKFQSGKVTVKLHFRRKV